MKDYYQILKIEETATEAEIKAAFRKLSKEFHPDTNLGDLSSEEQFIEIQEAYSTLINNKSRLLYNDKLKNYKFQAKFFNGIPQNGTGATLIAPSLDKAPIKEESNTFKAFFHKHQTLLLVCSLIIICLTLYILNTGTSEKETVIEDTLQPKLSIVQTKEDVEANFEKVKNIWKKFDGKWSGSGKQVSVKLNFSILLECDFDNNKYRVKYPSLGFGGSLKLLNMEEDLVSFEENLDFGIPSNMKTGHIDLHIINNKTLEYKYYFQNGIEPVALGILNKL